MKHKWISHLDLVPNPKLSHYTKTLITNKCIKRILSSIVSFLHVSTLLGHLQEELFVTVTLSHYNMQVFQNPKKS
jgi:hypothetical protein